MNSSSATPVFFIAGDASKIKYSRPKFPSLYFPIKVHPKHGSTDMPTKFSTAYLFYVSDIWQFTIYWCLLLYPSAYMISGIITLYNLLHVHQRVFTKVKSQIKDKTDDSELTPIISNTSISNSLKLNSSMTNNGLYYFLILIYLLLYPTIGLIYGAINGTVIGFLLGIIYRSGLFGMSTWVPLCVSCCSLLYTILSSYKLFGYAM